MFSYLIGEVKHTNKDYIVLENNNIGYKILMSTKSIEKLNINDSEKIYTEFTVREDGIYLYGFITNEEHEMFLMLTSVSSVGPKAALSILSTLSVNQLKKSIMTNDVAAVTQAPGIGKKTASRLILELSDKIDLDDLIDSKGEVKSVKQLSENAKFAVDALVNLGIQRNKAQVTVEELNSDELELQDLIKLALKKL